MSFRTPRKRRAGIQMHKSFRWIPGSPAEALSGFGAAPRNDNVPYTSFTFFSGRLRTGLPVAAWMALSTAGVTTQMVGSPTPPQKS